MKTFARIQSRLFSYQSQIDMNMRKFIETERESLQQRLCREPYHLSHSNVKLLGLIAAVQLDLNQGTKNIIITAPHAGSTTLIGTAIEAVADELKADVLGLDYHSIATIIHELRKKNQETKSLDWDLKRTHIFSQSFSPGHFELHDDLVDEVELSELDEEEDAKDFDKNLKSKLHFNINVIPGASKTDFLVSGLSLNKENPEKIIKQKYIEKFPFDLEFTEDEIKLYLDRLHEYILCNYTNRKLILYQQDLTDSIEGSNNFSGEKLLFGLLQLVEKLRRKSIQVVYVAGCSPCLSEVKNASKNMEFYSQLIEGNYYANTNGLSKQNIAMDGTLFDTPLDYMLDKFEKVQLLPPSQTFISLQRSMNPSKNPNILRNNASIIDRKFKRYLLQLDNDLKKRIAQINFKTISYTCIKRGLSLDLDLSRFANVTMNINTQDTKQKEALNKLKDLLEPLYTSVWSLDKIDRLVSVALAHQLDHSKGKSIIETRIGSTGLFQACVSLYETDITRFESMTGAELDDRTANVNLNSTAPEPTNQEEDDSNHETIKESVKNSDYLTNDLKKRGIKLNAHEKRILPTVINPETIPVSLSDIVLPPATKLVLQTLITLPMLRPDYFSTGVLARSSISGVLLFGPPGNYLIDQGTGKTMLAKAVAQSSGAWFMNVSLSDIFDKYVGEGEKNVKAIFSLARKLNGPCVIFLDEVDALFGTRRSDGSGSNRREVLNEFMSEWDGLVSKNHGIIVLGATNRPFDLDDAILRRMPRRILIDLPTEEARLKVLKVQLKGETLSDLVNLKDLAKRTVNYSGSDLRNVCVAAALARVKEDLVTKNNAKLSEEEIRDKISLIDDWNSYLKERPSNDTLSDFTLSPLLPKHFEIGIKECPPSLGDETQSLIDLRKWDKLYGDGAARKDKNVGIGFEVQNTNAKSL